MTAFTCPLAVPARVIAAALIFWAALGGSLQTATSQSNSDGSLYSRFGIGELQSFTSSQSEAMGESGYGLHSLNYVNFSNPATWSDQVLTRASAGFTYQNIRITDANGVESRLASGFLNGVQFSFPILDRKLGAAIGFLPFSRVSYHLHEEGVIYPSNPEPDTVAFAVDFEGGGGLQQLVGGLGYRIGEHISIGASVNGFFGIVENRRRTSFIESASAPQYIETNIAVATHLTGLTATFGSFASSTGILGEEDFLSVGAAFTLPTTLTGERVRTLGENLDRDTLGVPISGNVKLPWRLVAGIAYHPDSRWTITAGGKYEPWTNFRSDFTFPGYDLSDRMQAGAGIEFVPAGSDLLNPYYERIGYRLGFYYDRSYISPAPDLDSGIRTYAVTGGLSLPTLMSGTRLDINLQIGTRGRTDGELVRDVFYRLSANVNIGERWFQVPKLR